MACSFGHLRLSLFVVLFCLAAGRKTHEPPSYDHQTTTYHSLAHPSSCSETAAAVTPFFSPDSSIQTYVDLINEATESIDLYAPGFSSWSGCTPYDTSCVGCSLFDQRNESFPVFPALLNAVHRGVSVRIITNDYNSKTCSGQIAPLDYLFLNKIDVKFYASTTFMHAKYMMIDKGKKTSISSVNFSYTSFMKNREAGVVVEGGCEALVQFYSQVFEIDWHRAFDYQPTNTYSSTQMKFIQNPDKLPVNIPDAPAHPDAYITKIVRHPDVLVSKVYTSPDFARAQLTSTMSSVQKSFYLMIYQITDGSLCSRLADMQRNGITLHLLVSRRIYAYNDYRLAQDCYKQLNESGVHIRYTPSYYTYSHQKFWIVDEKEVHLDTGNWSPTDYPSGSTFPPSTSSSWKDVNRDLIVIMNDARIVKQFLTVYQEDYDRGTDWHPYHKTN